MVSLGWPRRRLTAATIQALTDQLGTEPCPVCAEAESSVRSWFTAYATETNSDPAMQIALRGSLGLCTAHTRRLLDQGAASSWLATSLFADIARTGIRRLDAGDGPPRDRCPPCAAAARRASGMLHLLRLGLRQTASLRDAYSAGPGVCLAHTVELLRGADAESARLVTDALLRRLAAEPPSQAATLVGVDVDGRRRARQWAQHHEAVLTAEERAVKASTAAYLDLMLAIPACPLCTASIRAGWRFLGWLATCGTPPNKLRLDAALCPTHLTDLGNIAAQEIAEEFVAYNAERATVEPHHAPCRACHVSDQARGAELRLMRIAAADPARSTAVVQAHGPCLRHALRLAASGELDPPWRQVIASRLRLLSYTLDTAVEHAAWDSRWKAHGAEMGAWRHAADLLDGEVLGPRAAELPPA